MKPLRIADCGLRTAMLLALVLLAGCGKPDPANRYRRPDQVLEFGALYAQNCAGCHGQQGQFGPAPPLADPLFLAIIGDDQLRNVVSKGRPGTPMPAFEKRAGGLLTAQQVEVLVAGLRQQWGKPAPPPDMLPSYRSKARGEAERGAQVFDQHCAQCHGPQGQGGRRAGALHDRAYLSLASDQRIRRIVITGRADLGMPGSGDQEKPLTNQEIADLVALMASWRSEYDSEE